MAWSSLTTRVAESPLIGQMAITNSGVLKLTTTKTYDNLNRLLGIQNLTSKTNLIASNYRYNSANQRQGNRLQDGSYWVYEYDDLGQVTSGKRYWEDGTPVAGQQFEYAFDEIGNRTSTKAGGDASGGSLRTATYGANLLNQYTNRTVPNAVDVIGIANAGATVKVNGQTTYRKGEYYQAALTVPNSTNVFQRVTNVASLSGTTNTSSGAIAIPSATQNFRCDPDGNLTNDGMFTYIWDHENRLLSITNNGFGGLAAQKITITYDSQGRRVRYVAQTNNAGTFVNTKFVRYVYDGWNLLAELNGTNSALINGYLWGADLSGGLQGAGGVGGLVAVKNVSLGYHAPAHDGNGNVMALVDAGTGSSSGSVSGAYEYGPFGEVIRASGGAAAINPFRFSTKYQDEETGLLYYGYRYYSAGWGRWVSRDPIEEKGGINAYNFALNAPVIKYDYLGMFEVGTLKPVPFRRRTYRLQPGTKEYVLNRCTINILAGHLTLMPGKLTVKRQDKGCAYGEIYACVSGGGTVELDDPRYPEGSKVIVPVFETPGIPGAPPKPHDYVDEEELVSLSRKAFEAAKTAARAMCTRCCCKQIFIVTDMFFKDGELERGMEIDKILAAELEKLTTVVDCDEK